MPTTIFQGKKNHILRLLVQFFLAVTYFLIWGPRYLYLEGGWVCETLIIAYGCFHILKIINELQ